MRKIYVAEINGLLKYLQNKPEDVFRFNTSPRDMDDEVMIDFKDYISSQMLKKVSSIDYKDLLASYSYINDTKKYKSLVTFDLANSVFNMYCDFLFKYSLVAMYLYLRHNKKIFLNIDEESFNIFSVFLDNEFCRSYTSNVFKSEFEKECSVEDLVKILINYDIVYIDMVYDLDLTYINYLYQCYMTSKGGSMFGNLF